MVCLKFKCITVLQIIGKNSGEDTLAHWPTALGMMTMDEASCEVLKYLDQIWSSLSNSGRCRNFFFFFDGKRCRPFLFN